MGIRVLRVGIRGGGGGGSRGKNYKERKEMVLFKLKYIFWNSF